MSFLHGDNIVTLLILFVLQGMNLTYGHNSMELAHLGMEAISMLTSSLDAHSLVRFLYLILFTLKDLASGLNPVMVDVLWISVETFRPTKGSAVQLKYKAVEACEASNVLKLVLHEPIL